MAQRFHGKFLLMLALFISVLLPGDIELNEVQIETPPTWPEGSDAYDNMATLANFGYRRIDSASNENARNWIADELIYSF